jgi:ABC-2 type transport system ATP-binding protein
VSEVDGVRSASIVEGGVLVVVDDAAAVVARVIDATTGAGATISSVEITRPNLEAVFLHLTGKALRD